MASMSVASSHGPPRMLGRYRIGERIGVGGTAEVYRAEIEGASGFAKTLVVKCLRPALVDEPELVEGLVREAKLAQRLHHGNIVQVLDFGVEDGRPYVVMEHVDGCSLHELQADLRRRGERMGLPEALFVVEEVAAALRYAHGLTDEQGVPLRLVHRDVKPRNVLVSREGVVKLADFGIAKLADDHGDTLPGVIKGTPTWLAPEQALGRGVDARTDVFALGRLLGALVDESEDEALRELRQRAAAEAPEDRFADVQSMLRALQRWRTAAGIDAGPGHLAAWVRRARQQAPVARSVALDAALLDGGAGDMTLTSAPGAASLPAPSTAKGSSPRSARIAVVVVVVALVGAVVLAWALGGPHERATPIVATPIAEPTVPNEREATVDRRAASPPRQAHPPARPPEPAATAPSDEPTTTPGRRREPSRVVAEPGRLQVNVLPWAEVIVDGRPRGRVPVDVELPSGRHRVRLENPQLGVRVLEVDVPAGGVHKISEW